MPKGLGAEFETEIARSIAHCFGGYGVAKIPDVMTPFVKGGQTYWKDRHKRPCDFVFPVSGGRTCWLECKATGGTSIPLDADHFKPHQWDVFWHFDATDQACSFVLCLFRTAMKLGKSKAINEVWGIHTGNVLALHNSPDGPKSMNRNWLEESGGVLVPQSIAEKRTWDLTVLIREEW